MRRRMRFVLPLVVPLIVLLLWALDWVILTQWIFPPLLFHKAVLKPIPASVHHIRGSGFLQAKNHHTYVLRFTISPEDVPPILAAHQLKPLAGAEYSRGILTAWETPRSAHSFTLFEGWRARVPRPWCQCARWRTLQAYGVDEGDNFRSLWRHVLFLYDPAHNEAYFVNNYVSGNWAWSLF